MGNDAGLAALSGASIVFDLDGTLVDTAPDLVGMLNLILTQEGLAPLPMDEARRFIGHGAPRMIEQGLAAAGAAAEGERLNHLVERGRAHYLAHIADHSRPFPGAVEALTFLKNAGALLAICTNKQTYLSRALVEALGLTHLFDAIVGADAAPAPKPDRRHLEAAVLAASGTLDRAIMVGDAATDADAARAAGVPLILVSFGYSETPAAELNPDILIDRFDQLPEACVRLLSACEV